MIHPHLIPTTFLLLKNERNILIIFPKQLHFGMSERAIFAWRVIWILAPSEVSGPLLRVQLSVSRVTRAMSCIMIKNLQECWLKIYAPSRSKRQRETDMEEWKSGIGLKVKSQVRGHQDYERSLEGRKNAYNKSVSQGKEPFSKARYPRNQRLGQDGFPEPDKHNAGKNQSSASGDPNKLWIFTQILIFKATMCSV